jgi:hypothetical protein
LKKTTVNRYLRQWGYGRETLRRQPGRGPLSSRHSNDCWQFDLCPNLCQIIRKVTLFANQL